MGVRFHAQDAPVAQLDDAVGYAGDGRIVRDDDGRRAQLGVDALDHVEHQLAGGVVQRPGRFVAQQHVGALDDGARNGHPLLLAAGELGRKMIAARRQSNHGNRLGHRHRVVRDVGHQRHVLGHGQAGNEVVELEHEADVTAPVLGQRRFASRAQVLLAEHDLTGAGGIEPAQDVEQGRLAAAGGAQQHDEFAAGNVQVDFVQGAHGNVAAAVGLAQAPDAKHRLRRCGARA